MATYFVDSSAIAKRYLNETGSAWVVSITSRAARNRIHLAGITAAEVVAAVARRQRSGSITLTDAAAMLVSFRSDLVNQYRIVDVSRPLILRAMLLAETYALRGYDAVQLAAALDANDRRVARKLPPLTLVSADGELSAAAQAEGLAVEDPNAHP